MKVSLVLLGLLMSFASQAVVPTYKFIQRIDPNQLSGKKGFKNIIYEQEILVKTRHNFYEKLNSNQNLAGISCLDKKSAHIWNFSNLIYNAHMMDIMKINGRDARIFYYSIKEAKRNNPQFGTDKGRIAVLKMTGFNQVAAVTVIMNERKEIVEIRAQGLDTDDPVANRYCVSKAK